MAALTRPSHVTVRGARTGEGPHIAALWRELWDAHEVWGGYPGSRDARVYGQLAARLDDDARVRGGHPILGRHIHLVADLHGVPCGQVEGWFERHGVEATTPYTCEVRSLIVTERARGIGAGRALLTVLADAGRSLARGAPCVLAAEVLEPNPAHAFYTSVGYAPVAWCARIDAVAGTQAPPFARVAVPGDALALARLEATLAARRRAAGDPRFDRPRAVDATMVGAIAAHLASDLASSTRDPTTLVALDRDGAVRASAGFTVHPLEPPFVPMRRALLGRFAVDPAFSAYRFVPALVTLGCQLALARAAPHVEVTDLSPPGTELHAAVLAAGSRPWSRVVVRAA